MSPKSHSTKMRTSLMANFIGPKQQRLPDVEMTRRVTLTLHTQNKMAEGMTDLYLFGEDFEAILEILEGNEDLEKQFQISASDVSAN